MPKSVRIVGALLGGLIGIGLIVVGGIGLRGSVPVDTANDEVRTQLEDAQLYGSSSSELMILVRSSSAMNIVDVQAIVHKVSMVPKVDSVQSAEKIPALMNKDKNAALIVARVAGNSDDFRVTKATVLDTVNQIPPQDGRTIEVLGPTDPPSWRAPASWAGTGLGAFVVFASGALVFAGSRRSSGPSFANPQGYPPPASYQMPATYPPPHLPQPGPHPSSSPPSSSPAAQPHPHR